MKYRAPIIALTAVAGLSACQADRTEEEAVDPPQTALPPSPEDGEAVSILRPDIEQPDIPTELDPLLVTVGFAEGGAELDEAAIAVLEEKLLYSRQLYGPGSVTIRGHSDSGGTDAANLNASQERADAVAEWLAGQGIEGQRVTVIAFGEQNPVEPNALPDGSPNEAGRAANRRVEIEIPGGEFSSSEIAEIDKLIAADRAKRAGGRASGRANGGSGGSAETGD